ncbi:TRAP transporter substrate-binding protein [Telmatospirillum sp. J64-1]|uniref:TRAP transporter substrate-binding protein n=1 Tax=Telmatospirillum sp. J64-1 TaxID=2502183 RepID=UPI00115F35BB|nr:TRAP transporter substrate-binding protein [Telmatospirillum sp. J64-1]
MKRREFLSGAAVTGVAGAAFAASSFPKPAIAQGKQEWRMVTTWPKNFPGIGVGAARLGQRITEMSDGRLTVRVYSQGELVPALQAFDAVIEGSAEMSHGTPYYWHGKSRAANFFSGVPFGMTANELSAWIRYLGGQEVWDEVYAQFGVKAFLSGQTGTQAGGWFRRELTGLSDIRGLKFRTPGLGGQVWERLGATVVNLPASELFQALQSGALDAAEFVGPYNDLALGFHQVAKNYYFPSFIEPGMATELTVSKAKFEALPKDLQKIVEIACQAEYEQVTADFYAHDPQALRVLVEKHGVQVHQFPEEIVEAGAKASADILRELREGGDPLTQKTAESFIKAMTLLRERTQNVDMAFLQAREKFFTNLS